MGSSTSGLEASVENCIPCVFLLLHNRTRRHLQILFPQVDCRLWVSENQGNWDSLELPGPRGHTDTVCHSEWAAHPLGAPSFVSLSLGAGRAEGLGNQAK